MICTALQCFGIFIPCACLYPAGVSPGPVAAAYKAIDQLYDLAHVPELTEYTVNSLTEGIEALVTTRWVSVLEGGRGISPLACTQ
jgi:hypothetical protein